MQFIKFVFISLIIMWLTACASISSSSSEKNNLLPTAPSAATRTKMLLHIQNWNISGMIGVRNSVKNSILSANIKWHQQGQQYTILLFGPLGIGTVQLTGQPGLVKLQDTEGTTFTAHSPEALLTQQTNWILPVTNLYYWIRCLPVPHLPYKSHTDNLNRLVALEQQGWHIQYLSYISVNNIDMPHRIYMFNHEMNVKIIINNWKI